MATQINSALLAYDGSPKANEALLVSAYIAGHLNIPLVVVTVTEVERIGKDLLSFAKEYLNENNVKATFVNETGLVRHAIIKTAREYNCDLIIMGGYGRSPMMEMLFGSTIDQILRTRKFPILICR
jgi:nucleotide-binding universal stress UspA family protein